MSSDAGNERSTRHATQAASAGESTQNPQEAPISAEQSGQRAVLLGRHDDLRRLRALYRAVGASGRPQTVAITGAQGLGKTRLVREFLHHEKDARVYRGTAREGDAVHGALARLLRGRFGVLEGAPAELSRERVATVLSELFGDRKVGDVGYLLGSLLGVEFRDSPLVKALASDPEQLASTRKAVLQRLIELDARSAPGTLVLVLDDMHNAPVDAHALLLELARGVDAPVMFVISGRPEMLARHEGWVVSDRLARSLLELGPLDDDDAEQVMRQLLAPAGQGPLVDELADYAVGLSLGNPALLEQMVHVFHDMGVLTSEDPFSEHESWTIHADRIDQARLPLTVEDAVSARISSLSPQERELLERAALMGGVFWLGGLLAIERAGKSPPLFWRHGQESDRQALVALLDELTQRDYVLRLPESTFAGEVEYVFKHNLERETLLRGVPAATAKRWHHAVAEWLSLRDGGEGNDEHLASLARHYQLGGRAIRAGLTYLRAADVARAEFANAKAAELYRDGLALLREYDQIPPEVWLMSHHAHGDVLHALGRNDAAHEAYREMLAAAHGLDMPAKGGAAHAKIGRLFRETGRLAEATEHLQVALRLFETAGDERGVASTTDDLGKLAWLRGKSDEALRLTERALVQRRALGETRSVGVSLNNLGLILQDRGEWLRAAEAFEEALLVRRDVGDSLGVADTLGNLGSVAERQGDDRRARDMFLEALGVARDAGDKARQIAMLVSGAESYLRLRDPGEALAHLVRAERLADELGDGVARAHTLRSMARAHLQGHDVDAARRALTVATRLYDDASHRSGLGSALRELAEVEVLACATEAAKSSLERAVAVYEGLGNEPELVKALQHYAAFLGSAEPYAADAALDDTRRELAARIENAQRKVDAGPR